MNKKIYLNILSIIIFACNIMAVEQTYVELKDYEYSILNDKKDNPFIYIPSEIKHALKAIEEKKYTISKKISDAIAHVKSDNSILLKEHAIDFAMQAIDMLNSNNDKLAAVFQAYLNDIQKNNFLLTLAPDEKTRQTRAIVTGAVANLNNVNNITMAGTLNMTSGIKILNNGTSFLTSTGANNTGMGSNSLSAITTGSNNTAMGFGTLDVNTTGINNSAFGSLAMANNTTGSGNTIVGASALNANLTGANNVALGASSLAVNTNSNNTALGYQALALSTAGSNNTALGYQAGNALVTGTNNIYIAHNGVNGDNNTIRIGTGQGICYHAGVYAIDCGVNGLPVVINDQGQMGTGNLSSRRYKNDIQELNLDEFSNKIDGLTPVKFTYKNDKTKTEQVGFIAEDVAKLGLNSLIAFDQNNNPQGIKYQLLAVLLVNEIKQLKAKNNEINDKLTKLLEK